MRVQEQHRLTTLVNQFADNDHLYELIDLVAMTYRVSKPEMEFYDYLRVMLADTSARGGEK